MVRHRYAFTIDALLGSSPERTDYQVERSQSVDFAPSDCNARAPQTVCVCGSQRIDVEFKRLLARIVLDQTLRMESKL